MLVKIYGSALLGIQALSIEIEVSVSAGISFSLVGLPDSAVKESQYRIESALRTYGFRIPGKKVIINMAPADIRKEGSAYDLPIAIGILAASEQINAVNPEQYLMMGELSLDGTLKPVHGVLSMVLQAKKDGCQRCIFPSANLKEASATGWMEVMGADSLKEVIHIITEKVPWQPYSMDKSLPVAAERVNSLDFKDVQGQEYVKRGFEIAAAGNHNILMIGSPGSGKTMMAQRLPGILPLMDIAEAVETTCIYSAAGMVKSGESLIIERPFRAPHHTISDVAMIGGGRFPKPGEISLAHNGVLFLDEFPEFRRTVLEVLRQPLENRNITISRLGISVDYPANVMFIASMNPCPCGYYSHPEKECICGESMINRYQSRISGPLLDRIDLHIEVPPVEIDRFSCGEESESSIHIRQRVTDARIIQSARFKNSCLINNNAGMGPAEMKEYCRPDREGEKLIITAANKLGLSARGYGRILKIARTVADLDKDAYIRTHHIAEAIQYRCLDRNRNNKYMNL